MDVLKRLGPRIASDLAKDLKISAMAVRQHLYALDEEGLVSYSEEKQSRGRPVKRWHLTRAAEPLFPDNHRELASSLIRALEKKFGTNGLKTVLTARSRNQIKYYSCKMKPARSLEDKAKILAALRTEEGYMADARTNSDGSISLTEHHCPIREAAGQCIGICAEEMRVFQTLLGKDIKIERETHILKGDSGCRYRICKRK